LSHLGKQRATTLMYAYHAPIFNKNNIKIYKKKLNSTTNVAK